MSIWAEVSHLSPNDYRRFALACCHRIEYLLKDPRLKKALRKLEQFVEDPENHQVLNDAYNIANSVYPEIRGQAAGIGAEAAAACTLLCATETQPVPNLLGNLESAVEMAEGLTREASRNIQSELLAQIMNPQKD